MTADDDTRVDHLMITDEKRQKTKCRMAYGEHDVVYDRPLRKFVHTRE